MHAIGADVSERLDVIPAQFRVLVTHRPKYACRACEQAVVQAPARERLIKGGLPTEAMVASVLVSKYASHGGPRVKGSFHMGIGAPLSGFGIRVPSPTA
jgi:transposase